MISDIIQSILPMSQASLAAVENLMEYRQYSKGETFHNFAIKDVPDVEVLKNNLLFNHKGSQIGGNILG